MSFSVSGSLRSAYRVSDQMLQNGLPDGPFATIVADPPWDYRDGLGRGSQYTPRGAERHYELMTVGEIADLPVDEIALLDSHLYLWVTSHFVLEARTVMAAWDFKFKTMLTWVKPGRKLGLGHYFRNNTEHVLFGVRGRLRLARRDVPTAFSFPRRSHSEKPEEFFALVESCSPGPYLELFSRKIRPGWTTWGDEAGKLPNQGVLVRP